MNALSVSVTERGRALAAQLPFEHQHGRAADTVRARWHDTDAFVLFIATGAAVRIVAPLLGDKRTDPAVVCVDEAGRFAIALCGAHERGGNDLARRVGALLGAQPVITTAADAVVGVGASRGAPGDEVAALVESALQDAGVEVAHVVATIDLKRDEPALRALDLPMRTFPAEDLAAVDVPTPSAVVDAAVGTPSVAEAAALLAAGPNAELVSAKRSSAHATAAIALPRGGLRVVGLGPGAPALRTPAAVEAVRDAEVVIGYAPYVEQCADLLRPTQDVLTSPIGEEAVRAKQALAEAARGRRVALVCSGDPGVFAMASLVLELAPEAAPSVEVVVVPGVTAALAASALLGAALGHDHAVISLSDLHTSWEVIERRVQAAAEADLVVAFYNPRSSRRTWQLAAARRVLLARRSPSTPVGVVRNATRPDERVQLTTLGDLDTGAVDMWTCVLIGSSTTRVVGGRMVTPR